LNHRMSEGNAKLCLERSDLITLADGQFLWLVCGVSIIVKIKDEWFTLCHSFLFHWKHVNELLNLCFGKYRCSQENSCTDPFCICSFPIYYYCIDYVNLVKYNLNILALSPCLWFFTCNSVPYIMCRYIYDLFQY
jgi:hypothetical protein